MHPLHLNFQAILASAAILWVLGAIWYSPALFAKSWAAMIKPNPATKKRNMIMGSIASLVCDIILSLMLVHMVLWSGAESYGEGAMIGFIVWMGFFAAPNLPQSIYEGRPFSLFAINTGYMLVGLPIIGGLLAVWR